MPGDLFVSFWLGKQLTVVTGDAADVLLVERSDLRGIRVLVEEFERSVCQLDHYAAFFPATLRPSSWPKPTMTMTTFAELLEALRSHAFPPQTLDLLQKTRFERLLLFPDGFLHALPFEHLLFPKGHWAQPSLLARGVVYAPSASAYVYATRRRRREPPARALVVLGDREDPSLVREAQRVVASIPCPSTCVSTLAELRQQTETADLIYIAAHGQASIPSEPDRGWALLFDGGRISAEDFYREQITLARGATVVLSACSVGRVTSGAAHEIDGLLHGLFFAGAATVLAARWPVVEQFAEPIFAGTINRVFRDGAGFGAGLRLELLRMAERQDSRDLFAAEEALPFFFGAFAVYGCGD